MRPKRDLPNETKLAEAVLAAWLASLADPKPLAAAEGETLGETLKLRTND